MESVCVNCGSAGGSMLLEDEQILYCIRQWTAPMLVQAHDLICSTCWTLAQEETNSSTTNHVGRDCALCNRMLAPRTRSHQLIGLRSDTQHHLHIRSIIAERLMPLEIRASHYICHPCWQKCDRAAKQSSNLTPAKSNQLRCANCGIHLNRQKRHILCDDTILMQIQQLVAPRIVTSSDYICDACHSLFLSRDPTSQDNEDVLMVGHQHVCIVCGCSVARIRSHSLGEENCSHILEVVQHWIQPREIKQLDLICHKCYQKANSTDATNNILFVSVNPVVPRRADSIILPKYSRASATHSRCIFIQCNSTKQVVVPFVLRVRLFRDLNYYVPPDSRICKFHLASKSWLDLLNVENVRRDFTAAQIEDFCELLKH